MGKGSQQAPAGGTTRTVSLPDYADPYFRRLLKGSEEATQPFYPDDPAYGDLAGQSTYVPYGGERLADSSAYGDINTSRAMVRGIAESPIGGLGEAAALQRRGIAGLEGLANYNTAAFNPYMGFQAGSADPYSGFQAGSADPFSGFQRQRGTEYTGFQAGAADPYSGFVAGSADPFSDFSAGRGREYTGFTAGEADAYGGFQAGRADPFSDFREAQFTAQTADQYDFDPARQFSGSEVQQYMDPYMQNVVDVQKREAREDFGRSQAARDAGAISAGAFGGSREGIERAEIGRNILDQQARTSAGLRQQGFAQAQQQQLQRAQAAAQGLGSLGMQQAKLGEAFQGMNINDINMLSSLGGQEQQQRQRELDAARQTQYQNVMQPYQQLGFYSDIFQGMPTSQSTFTSQQSPDPSMLSQIGGLGMGLYSLNKAFS